MKKFFGFVVLGLMAVLCCVLVSSCATPVSDLPKFAQPRHDVVIFVDGKKIANSKVYQAFINHPSNAEDFKNWQKTVAENSTISYEAFLKNQFCVFFAAEDVNKKVYRLDGVVHLDELTTKQVIEDAIAENKKENKKYELKKINGNDAVFTDKESTIVIDSKNVQFSLVDGKDAKDAKALDAVLSKKTDELDSRVNTNAMISASWNCQAAIASQAQGGLGLPPEFEKIVRNLKVFSLDIDNAKGILSVKLNAFFGDEKCADEACTCLKAMLIAVKGSPSVKGAEDFLEKITITRDGCKVTICASENEADFAKKFVNWVVESNKAQQIEKK